MSRLLTTSIFITVFLFISTCPADAAFWDSLIVIPAHPTTSDSIRLLYFRYFGSGDNCAGIYYSHDSTSVIRMGDTALLLCFQYGNNCGGLPCHGPDTGCSAIFNYQIGPLNAGKYSVYDSASAQLNGNPITGISPEKNGEFTVSVSMSVMPQHFSSKPIFKSDNKGCIYDIRGRMLSSTGSISQKYLPGVYYFKTGNNLTKKVILNK